MVDPGHGGSDVGAIGTLNGEDVYEKDLALLFGQAVAETLEDFGATVYLTRDDDSKVSIDDRWKLGQQKDVDGVISVHFNSAGSTLREQNPSMLETVRKTKALRKPFSEKWSIPLVHETGEYLKIRIHHVDH